MILEMRSQALLFLLSSAVGAFCAFLFDIFRVLRKIFAHSNLLVQIQDALYWLAVSFIMFYVMLMNNDGEIRFFLILGFLIGMTLYFLTLSILFLKISDVVIGFIKKVFFTMLKIIFAPFKLLLQVLKKPIGFLFKRARKRLFPFKKLLQKLLRYVRIKKRKAVNNLRVVLKKR